MWWVRAAVCAVGLAACEYPALQVWDAPVDAVPDLPHVVLTWQLATTAPSGAPSPTLEYPPFAAASAPQIRIATLDGAFVAAPYSSSPGKEGWIEIPRSYVAGNTGGNTVPWRLEYTMSGGVPHEIQWTPDGKAAHLVAPMVGRLDRQSAPVGGGYTVTPNNFAGPYHFPQLLTTGVWTAGSVDPPTTGATVDYDFFNARSLSGTIGRPDPARGDLGFLVDFISDPNTTSSTGAACRVAAGSSPLGALELAPGSHTAQTVSWDSSRLPVSTDGVALGVIARLADRLGKLHGSFEGKLSWLLYGKIPSVEFPGLTGASALSTIPLPIPVMQVLFQCPYDVTPVPPAAQPVLLEVAFPSALHVQLVDSRRVLGVTLLSGIETVIASSFASSFPLAFPAAMPTQITLNTRDVGRLDLSGDQDGLAVGPVLGTLTLAFVPEVGDGLRADYHDVILHRIVGGQLTTERVFTVTAPSVRIDGALLAPGADYVFEIRTYKGHPAAPRGDFAPVDYPYGAAIVFTRTFHTS